MASRNATLFFRLLLLTAFIALLLAWWCIPSVNAFIDHSLTAFLAVDQQGIERFIHSYGSQAAAVVFLASEAGAYITGETLAINGGLYMK